MGDRNNNNLHASEVSIKLLYKQIEIQEVLNGHTNVCRPEYVNLLKKD